VFSLLAASWHISSSTVGSGFGDLARFHFWRLAASETARMGCWLASFGKSELASFSSTKTGCS